MTVKNAETRLGEISMTSRMKKYATAIVSLSLTLMTSAVLAGQSVSSIAAAAALHAEARALEQGYSGVAVDLRPLDSRIQLDACAIPLQVMAASDRALGPVSMSVSCRHPNKWRVQVRGTVSAMAELPVLALPVNRGDVIGSGDIEIRQQRITRDLVGYLSTEQDIVGQEARKNLAVGSKLRKSDLVSPQIIDRGQTVALIAQSSGLVVNMQGKALSNGAAGDRLMVKNLSSGRRIEGLVQRNGTVLIQ
jgi:flagella basal body P-ring formation protein FlgA